MITSLFGYPIYSLEDLIFCIAVPVGIVLFTIVSIVIIVLLHKILRGINLLCMYYAYKLREEESE